MCVSGSEVNYALATSCSTELNKLRVAQREQGNYGVRLCCCFHLLKINKRLHKVQSDCRCLLVLTDNQRNEAPLVRAGETACCRCRQEEAHQAPGGTLTHPPPPPNPLSLSQEEVGELGSYPQEALLLPREAQISACRPWIPHSFLTHPPHPPPPPPHPTSAHTHPP